MRPSSKWTKIDDGWVNYMHRHGVRIKMTRLDDDVGYSPLAPTWAVTIAQKAHVGDPIRRRALRRAVKEPEFRLALLAAIDAGIERAFLASQELNINESEPS